MYTPFYDPKNVVTETRQLRFDFLSPSKDPVNTDSALHYVRPRQQPRPSWSGPNFLIGIVAGMMPLQDVFSRASSAKMPFGLNPTNPADSALPMPYYDYSVNGLKKVG